MVKNLISLKKKKHAKKILKNYQTIKAKKKKSRCIQTCSEKKKRKLPSLQPVNDCSEVLVLTQAHQDFMDAQPLSWIPLQQVG